MAGSPVYMSLRALQRKPPSFKDDIYAIGLTAGEILSSMHNFTDYDTLIHELPDTVATRNRYIQALDNAIKKKIIPDVDNAASEMHKMNSHIVLGAHHKPYQKGTKLTEEEIMLCKLILT